jgi:tRNA threonylcarbamoyladenosine biosynthesis protein TsaB
MLVLAIDTALNAVSVCVFDSIRDEVLASEHMLLERGHAEHLVPLLGRLDAKFAGALPSLARVAVTTGPGSFTGIRVGIAAARAAGIAHGIEVVGVSVFSAFAAPLIGNAGTDVGCVVDARHGSVFFESYDEMGAIVRSAEVVPVRQAAKRLRDRRTILTGPGASLVAIEAWSMGRKADVEGEEAYPNIEFVARLGAIADLEESPPSPFYLKAADVTPSGVQIQQAQI